MAASAGRNLRVKVSTTSGGSYNDIAGIKSTSMNLSGGTIDVSAFGTEAVERIAGLKGGSYSLSGNYEADANGQGVVRTAVQSHSSVFIRFLPDGTAGWQQECFVSAYNVTAAVDGAVEVSIELEGTGAITLVP
jgi:predicted secreted protein